MPSFRILNFGCRASQADGAALKDQLLAAGLTEGASPEASEIAVLNSCTVTATADAEVRQVIRRIHRASPSCRILVTGCYAQRAPQQIAELPGVAWVVGNSHKHTVAKILSEAFPTDVPLDYAASPADLAPPIPGGPLRQAALVRIESAPAKTPIVPGEALPARILVGKISEEFHFAPVFPDDRTRPTLKVQDGCNARCSFCIIPDVRGPSRSLHPDHVIEQVRVLTAAGYQEVVLSGINIGSYGKDLDRRITFLALVERLLDETDVPRLRISSIEPMDVSAELIRLVAREPRLAQHFHVPLQSGCDRILRRMNRRYWASHYAERILAIRDQIPSAAIGADVMVGFPGETAEDHAASARFIASLPFTYLHIFPFSARPNTPAAVMPGAVNGRVAKERGQELRAIVAAKRQAFLSAQINQTVSAVTLDEEVEGARVALTTNFLPVILPGADVPSNLLLNVSIARIHKDVLYGFPRRDWAVLAANGASPPATSPAFAGTRSGYRQCVKRQRA
jgi:threonylcarbamoyladenosine tRNA methylthiotransferase MtaB